MTQYDYDLFVIGAGSGGVRAARISAGYGARVAIAEEYRFGGTCVIRGCVPKKLFVYAGRFGGEFEDAAGFGWTLKDASFDWPTLVANKDKEIDRLEGIYGKILDGAGVKAFSQRAELIDAHTIRLIGSDETVTAERILIATGGTPSVPDIPGSELAISSNEAFHLEKFPERVVIFGAGYIAVEFASIFNGLGADVVQVYRGPQILRGFDDDMRDGLAEEMCKRGVDIRLNTMIDSIARDGSGYKVSLSTGDEIETDLVMFATGRTPNSTDLGLEAIGVETGASGAINVDANSRTSVENIYAVGDVTGKVALTPVALREGHAFADTVYGKTPTTVDYNCIPTAVFSEPEIGTVGLTEAEARERFDTIDIYKSQFRPMKHTLSGRDEKMIMKLVVDAASDRVLGCHILGLDGGEIVQMAAVAIRMKATKADFDATMALHPSAAEELVTMRSKWQPEAT